MVKYFIVIAHPEPKSMCQAIGNTAIEALTAAGHEVKVTRVYEQEFDPVLKRSNYKGVLNADHFNPRYEDKHATATNGFADDVEAEIQKLEWCDVLIFQFPLYWFSFPAALKGWVDRVFAFSRTFAVDRRFATGMFQGKKAILSITTGGPKMNYTAEAGNDLSAGLRHIQRAILEFVGFAVLQPNILFSAPMETEENRKAFLVDWAKRVVTLHEEPAIDVGRFV